MLNSNEITANKTRIVQYLNSTFISSQIKIIIMAHQIIILHRDKTISAGIESFLSSSKDYRIDLVHDYEQCLNSAKFLQELGSVFIVLIEGQLLDTAKSKQLVELDQARLIFCDHSVGQNSLLLALNCNSSYFSLEHSNAQSLILAINCALTGGVFICSQANKKLNNCVFETKLEQRKAVESLAFTDQQILALVANGYTYSSIGEQIHYSSLNISYRVKTIIQALNLQTKQEAIALANSIGLNSSQFKFQEV